MNCNNCNAYIRRNAQFCSFCGQPISPNVLPSKMHGYTMNRGCVPQFMSPMQTRPIRQVSRRKRGIMLLLWLFTGLFGGHHFYAGYIGKGVLYLFTFGLSGVGWLLDLFSILFGYPVDRDGMPINW